MEKVHRPKAPDKKISTKDDFELAYLRHQYVRRSKYNPSEAELAPYMKIVENLTKNTFFTYYNLFKNVGFYHDDVLNVGRVHLVSFLNLFTLDKSEEKTKDFEYAFYNKHKNKRDPKDLQPKPNDFLDKDKANFTMFLKQRMEDLVRVCYQKSRNIKGQNSEEYHVFCSEQPLPKYLKSLIKSYKELGYKKIDFSIFKSIRKKADVNQDATVFKFDNVWYVAIPSEQKELDTDDVINSDNNPLSNLHNLNPEDYYQERHIDDIYTKFDRTSTYRKRVLLRNFVAKHKNNRHYIEEVAAAKNMIKVLGE